MTEQLDHYIIVYDLDTNIFPAQSVPRKVPIYSIKFNKKNFCKPFKQMETKDGIQDVPCCSNYMNSKYCNKCIKIAKELARRTDKEERRKK
jgi:hypothetical protein